MRGWENAVQACCLARPLAPPTVAIELLLGHERRHGCMAWQILLVQPYSRRLDASPSLSEPRWSSMHSHAYRLIIQGSYRITLSDIGVFWPQLVRGYTPHQVLPETQQNQSMTSLQLLFLLSFNGTAALLPPLQALCRPSEPETRLKTIPVGVVSSRCSCSC